MIRALLVGTQPPCLTQYTYVQEPPFDAVVIGSLTLGQLLCFQQEQVLEALAVGKSVVLYTPGLPEAPKNRALAAALASRRRELKGWGVLFTDGAQKLKQSGRLPGPGAVLTPLAREILEGTD